MSSGNAPNVTGNASNHVMMVRPAAFGMNTQTAVDNFYQNQNSCIDAEQAQELALAEFDNFVSVLESHGVCVHVLQDTLEPITPDAIFPNNWVSLHSSGHIIYYPMKAENRRWERRADLPEILAGWGFSVPSLSQSQSQYFQDHSHHEKETALSASSGGGGEGGEGRYLEGTGSLIFDHDARIVYCARSQRASEQLVAEIAAPLGYTPVVFSAFMSVEDQEQDREEWQRQSIYHTNVMMCVTDKYAVVCLQSIDSESERTAVCEAIKSSGKDILEITEEQKHNFAGNMLLVKGKGAQGNGCDKLCLVMSATARAALTEENVAFITAAEHEIVSVEIPTIERLGGGSARCMLCEVYLPRA